MNPTVNITTVNKSNMDFDYRGQRYGIRFYHETFKNEVRGFYRIVWCSIVRTVDGVGDVYILGKGQAICAPEDRFNKETGRKLALTRALHDYEKHSTVVDAALEIVNYGAKKFRTAVWNSYFGRKK